MNSQTLLDVESTIVDSLVRDFTGKMQTLTDDELVKAARNGGSAAADELLSRHQTLLYKSVLRLAASTEEAEDAVQDALFRAYMNIGKFRGDCKFSSWLIAIGINSVRSARRKSRRAMWVSLDDAEKQFSSKTGTSLQDHQPSPELQCSHRERFDAVKRAMQRLPRKHRIVSLHKVTMEGQLRAVRAGWGLARGRSRAG
ncbi:RNA polymerase sigma factor (sigma-70 family) [Granulicella aggregans]|uniref:RNA polymerase sigma factor (Sigma-70 family) n=2 Tax=Granulicella aggregans TaxID=474949 RepID=A0A7W7ZGA4_9BACT|nr:RNA polymerase sigma factor (sigma-70 family) [Granulicella aggregans]